MPCQPTMLLFRKPRKSKISEDVYVKIEDDAEAPADAEAASADAEADTDDEEFFSDAASLTSNMSTQSDGTFVMYQGGHETADVESYEFTDEFNNWYTRSHFEHRRFDVEQDLHRKVHWYVVCLEKPMDMNIYLKRKSGLSDRTVRQLMHGFQIGKEEREVKYFVPQTNRLTEAFSVARYLAFGYCGDGHKLYKDVDTEPLFGPGDIDIKTQHLRTWLTHAIEKQRVKSIAELLPTERDASDVEPCAADAAC